MNLKELTKGKQSKSNKIYDGIDIINEKDEHLVGFNPNHQNNVDTNDLYNPKPIYNTINGLEIISIFQRLKNDRGNDGNPLIHALKHQVDAEGKIWNFLNPKYDLMALLRRFVAVTKEIKGKFDTIITIPSKHDLNERLLDYITSIIPHDRNVIDFFDKYDAETVLQSLDWNQLEIDCGGKNARYYKLKKKIEESFGRMIKENNGNFSYRFINPTSLRRYVTQTMAIANPDENYVGELINDKNVLVIDDTYATGSTLGDAFDAITLTYSPKKITFLTLLSPLKQ